MLEIFVLGPLGVAINSITGDVYVSECYGKIRKITPQGIFSIGHRVLFFRFSLLSLGQVTTIAGSGNPGFADGPALSASLNLPCSICFGLLYNCLFIADSDNHRIRILDLQSGIVPLRSKRYILSFFFLGIVSSIGKGKAGYKDGEAEEAQFNCPRGVEYVEIDGSVLVADTDNNKIRRISFESIHLSYYLELFH